MGFWLSLTITIYIAGIALTLFKSGKRLIGLKEVEKFTGQTYFRSKDWIIFFLIDPLLWPVHLLLQKNPLEIFSETFFKKYGDGNTHYYGTRGLKNFLNDYWFGKNRYVLDDFKSKIVEVDKSNTIYQDGLLKNKSIIFAEIIFGKWKNYYLLSVAFSDKKEFLMRRSINRYVIDQCETLSRDHFYKKIADLSEKAAQEIRDAL